MSSDDVQLVARSSPAGFAHVCSQGRWLPFEHLLILNEHLLQVVAGEIDRLIVTMPPRHGKSELISHWLPAWYLGTFPDAQVMLASYEATFARNWGRKAREALTEHGPWVFGVGIADEPRAADWWMVDKHDGVMVTAGVGGALTGKGANLLVIDDPIKNAEEAASDVIRAKHWDWWQSTASTRLQPGGAVVLVLTRWHEDDLAGKLLADDPDRWHVLNLPAFAEEHDELGRDIGHALCPELYDLEALKQIRSQVGGYFWTAMYQQRPAPPEGFLFKRADMRYWRTETEMLGATPRVWYILESENGSRRFDTGHCVRFQTVDAAISEDEMADWTVVATWAATPDGDLLLLDLERRHFEEQRIASFLAAANDNHGRCPMWVERFGAGRSPLATLSRQGYPVMEIPPEAGTQVDKITRAFGAISLYEQHKVFHPMTADWLGGYENELASFPNAAHDDMVDVTSYAARLLPSMGVGRRPQQQTPGVKPITAGIRNVQF